VGGSSDQQTHFRCGGITHSLASQAHVYVMGHTISKVMACFRYTSQIFFRNARTFVNLGCLGRTRYEGDVKTDDPTLSLFPCRHSLSINVEAFKTAEHHTHTTFGSECDIECHV